MYHLYPNSRRISRYPIRPPSPCRRRHGASDNFRGDSCDGSIVAKHRSPAQLCAAWEAGPRGLFRHGDHGEAVKTAWRNVQKLEKVMLNHLEYNEFNPISRGYLQIHSFVMGVGGRWVQKSWTISMEQRKITPKNASTNFNNWDEGFWRLSIGDARRKQERRILQKMDQGCGLHHQEHYSKMDQQRFTLNSHLDLSKNGHFLK